MCQHADAIYLPKDVPGQNKISEFTCAKQNQRSSLASCPPPRIARTSENHGSAGNFPEPTHV